MDLVLSGMNGEEKAKQISKNPEECPAGPRSSLSWKQTARAFPGPSEVLLLPGSRAMMWAGISLGFMTQLLLLRIWCHSVSLSLAPAPAAPTYPFLPFLSPPLYE